MKCFSRQLLSVIIALAWVFTASTAYAGIVDKNGTLELIKQAEQSGNPLSGAIFGVYGVTDNRKIVELTTNADGKVSLSLEPGKYYLRELKAPYGYQLEPAWIFFTVENGTTVKVEVTNQRDTNIRDADTNGGVISIPKTGEDLPIMNYVVGLVLVLFSIVCILKSSIKKLFTREEVFEQSACYCRKTVRCEIHIGCTWCENPPRR